jgi:hypothetical protein
MRYISIVNFEEHQHYKDRNVVWIKLYLNLLTSYKLSQLTPAQRWLYVALLLLAPAKQNLIPYDIPFIRSQCGLYKSKQIPNILEKMVKLKLIVIVSDSKLGQSACLEEKERKKEKKDSNFKFSNGDDDVRKTIEKARETLRSKFQLKV